MRKQMHMEFPVRAVPWYIKAHIDEAQKQGEIPPGHLFLLYFQAMAHSGLAFYEDNDRARKNHLSSMAKNCAWKDFQKEVKEGKAEIKDLYGPIRERKLNAILDCVRYDKATSSLSNALSERQGFIQGQRAGKQSIFTWHSAAKLVSPLVTGVGNPHPVEVGFSFLNPYGIPYIPGAGVKGVFRKAAEELSVLFNGGKGWNLVLVWILFGFDATAAPFCEGSQDSPIWKVYKQAFENLREDKSALELLEPLIGLLNEKDLPLDPKKFFDAIYEDPILRRTMHWQGILCFEDAFPEGQVSMGADILNPHHKAYYESGQSSPHDAEQPVPVYFLVLKPGITFTFRVIGSKERLDHFGLSGRCKDLLNSAFEHACHSLGFGAKTSVGYGALEPK